MLTHIGVWVKTKMNILYPLCKFNIFTISLIRQTIGCYFPRPLINPLRQQYNCRGALCFRCDAICKDRKQIYIFLIEVLLTRGKLLYPFKSRIQGLLLVYILLALKAVALLVITQNNCYM